MNKDRVKRQDRRFIGLIHSEVMRSQVLENHVRPESEQNKLYIM